MDSLALSARKGPATLFITVTANDFPEIMEMLLPGQTSFDRPDLVARVFRLKVQWIVQELRTIFNKGKPERYRVYVIEYQKRGWPHAHIVIK
jgi:hypothetical protein